MNTPRSIILTGATGFVGRALAERLARTGHPLLALVRDRAKAGALPCRVAQWDPTRGALDAESLQGAAAVVHLAGEPVAETRWTPEIKNRILSSRVQSTRSIVDAISRLPAELRPATLINASAIGYYGDRGDELLNEDSLPGTGFLSDVCQQWEAEALRAEALGLRVVRLRIGVVLGAGGGALARMQPVRLGSGRQWTSWIHLEDLVAAIERAISDPKLRGAINAVAPSPIRNSELTRELARARHWPSALPASAPGFVLKAALGEMAQVILASQKVTPQALLGAGFDFKYPSLSSALREIHATRSRDEEFTASQFVARPIGEVFDFFSRAENLEALTPPWLQFKVVGKSSPEIQESTLIDYRLKIHGIPVRWQSRIEEWKANERFVDTQIRGPYAKWHHTHDFEAVPGGTLVRDRVLYRVPGGAWGQGLLGNWIRKDIRAIFAYRKKKIDEVFGG